MVTDITFKDDDISGYASSRPVGHFDLPCASVSKRVFVQNLSHENEFDSHENEHVRENIFLKMVSHEASFRLRGKRQLGTEIFDKLSAPSFSLDKT